MSFLFIKKVFSLHQIKKLLFCQKKMRFFDHIILLQKKFIKDKQI